MREPLHMITCEYPPRLGGVSDFSRAMAERLAASGREVHVWAPGENGEKTRFPSLHLHGIGKGFDADNLRRLEAGLRGFPSPARLIVHWVPHGYGHRAMNWQFCLWLLKRQRDLGDRVELIIHEPFVGFERTWKQWPVAVVHRGMLAMLLSASEKVWLSTPAWESRVRPWLRRVGRAATPMVWLPLAIDMPVVENPRAVAELRAALQPLPGEALLGHFGTYGESVTRLLTPALEALLSSRSSLSVLLLGRGGDLYREIFSKTRPDLSQRIHSLGESSPERVSIALQSCDLFLQPYPDGITARRTTALAILAHGKAIVTTNGHLTEASLWNGSNAVHLVPLTVGGITRAVEHLLDGTAQRAALAARGGDFYRRRFLACDYEVLFREEEAAPARVKK